MTKLMRKYQKWLMVVFGVLLMLAFLGGPAINEISSMQRNRVVGRIDDTSVKAADWHAAVGEAAAFTDLARRGFPAFDVGLEDDNSVHHWLLLTREAQEAGLVGEPSNGEKILDSLVPMVADQAFQAQLRSDYQLLGQWFQADEAKKQVMLDTVRGTVRGMITSTLSSSRLTEREMHAAIAKLMAVHQLKSQYMTAPHVSSRLALIEAKQNLDAATGDAVVIPASQTADQIPAPTPEELQAHFEKYKSVKPGDGDYGIGYFLPARVKIEYLKLSREAIQNAVQIDPVEVSKRFRQDRTRYPGELGVERPRIESEIRAERADSIMREAQSAMQREVQKATRRLESSGRYKTLPADWEQQRPQFGQIAQAVVDSVKSATGVTIPAPEVVVKSDAWLTQQELAALPGIGMSRFTQGGLEIPFPAVVFWVREFSGTGPLPLQVGIPVVEAYLSDFEENRYFFTVLATRQESAPDSVAEIHDKAVQDYRTIVAFEQLKARIPELSTTAATVGLSRIVDQFNLRPAPAAEGTPPPADPIKTDLRITRAGGGFGDAALQEEGVRKQIMDAADDIDPMLAAEQIPAQTATQVVAAPRHLSIVVFRVKRLEPLTVEMVQNEQTDTGITQKVLFDQMRTRTQDAFSLSALLKRHAYYTGKKRIETVQQLRGGEEG